jgi:uncharacterized protein
VKYFAVLLPMQDVEKSQTLRQQHLDFLAAREKEGTIFARGRFVDGSGGMVIYKVESFDEVKKLTAADPYVSSGTRGCVIHEWDMFQAK